jgi:uncharacterized protein YxjI
MDITYTVKRQFWQIFGTTVRTYDAAGKLVCLAHAKAFKLREQIIFYDDETRNQVLFSIQARQIIDLGATYDITDAKGQRLGSLRRKGLSSTFVRDEWLLLDANEQHIGTITEDSQGLGILRRYLNFAALLIPQRFEVNLGGQPAGTIQQNKNTFTVKLQCSFSSSSQSQLGETLLLAIPNILAAIEARQS